MLACSFKRIHFSISYKKIKNRVVCLQLPISRSVLDDQLSMFSGGGGRSDDGGDDGGRSDDHLSLQMLTDFQLKDLRQTVTLPRLLMLY
jgi:hypothetical protein